MYIYICVHLRYLRKWSINFYTRDDFPTNSSSPFSISLFSSRPIIISKTYFGLGHVLLLAQLPQLLFPVFFPRWHDASSTHASCHVARVKLHLLVYIYIYRFSTILYVIRIYRAERQGWLLYGDLPKRGRCTCSKRIRGYLVTSGSPRLKIGPPISYPELCRARWPLASSRARISRSLPLRVTRIRSFSIGLPVRLPAFRKIDRSFFLSISFSVSLLFCRRTMRQSWDS